MLSALMTVPPSRSASASASADFPLQVGPATITACRTPPPLPFARPMSFVLTLIGAPGAVTPALAARVAASVGGGAAETLSPGEAADIPCLAEPDPDAVRAALAGAPVD